MPLLTWWRNSELVWGLDGSFPIKLVDINRYFSLTTTAYAAPDARKLSFIIPWGLLLRGWKLFGLPWNAGIAERIFDVSLLLASAFGCRSFIKKLLPHVGDVATTLAALFYVANTYVLTTVWSSQSYLIVHYSLLPILATVIIGSLESKSLLRWAATGLAWTLMMSPAYITTTLLATDMAMFAIIAVWTIAARQVSWRQVAVGSLVILISWLMLNLYWIIPLVENYSTTFAEGIASIAGTQSEALFRLNSAPLLPALRLNGYWGLTGSVDGSAYYPWATWDNTIIDLLAYIPVIFGILALLASGTKFSQDCSLRTHRTMGFLAISLLIVLFLVTGGTGPLGSLKVEAFNFLHLLAPFRSVYQSFMEYMPLVLAPLMAAGIGTAALGTNRLRAFIRVPGHLAVWCVALLAIIVVPLPWWSGAIYAKSGVLPSNRVTVPISYTSLADRITAGNGSILTLPIGTTNVTYLQWDEGSNGFRGIQPLSFMTAIPNLDQAPAGSYVRKILTKGFDQKNLCSALERLNVDYVAFETDADVTLMKAIGGYLGLPLVRTATLLRSTPCLDVFGDANGLTLYKDVRWKPNLVSFSQSPNQPGTPAKYHIDAGGVIVVDPPDHTFRFAILNEPNDGGWTLNGVAPRGGHDVTAFDLGRHISKRMTLMNVTTSEMRYLLVLAVIIAATIGGAFVFEQANARRVILTVIANRLTRENN